MLGRQIDKAIYIAPINSKESLNALVAKKISFHSEIVWRDRRRVPAAVVRVEGRSTLEYRRPRSSYHQVYYMFAARAASACYQPPLTFQFRAINKPRKWHARKSYLALICFFPSCRGTERVTNSLWEMKGNRASKKGASSSTQTVYQSEVVFYFTTKSAKNLCTARSIDRSTECLVSLRHKIQTQQRFTMRGAWPGIFSGKLSINIMGIVVGSWAEPPVGPRGNAPDQRGQRAKPLTLQIDNIGSKLH